MSIALMTLAFKAALPPTPKFVLVALCDSANDQGECYPSVTTLTEKCSMGERTVQGALKAIEAAGGLRREFRKGRSTVYWLTPAAIAPRSSCPPQQPHPTPADVAPPPPQQPHPTPAAAAPITIIESSVEPKKREKRAPVGTRLAEAWMPSESDLAYAADKGVDAQVEGESFRDHWLADTTPKALKADWAAAWRTWVRNSLKFSASRGSKQPAGKSFRERDAENGKALVREWTGGLMHGLPELPRNDPNTIDMEAPHGTAVATR